MAQDIVMAETPPRLSRTWLTFLAWVVIVGLVGFVAFRQQTVSRGNGGVLETVNTRLLRFESQLFLGLSALEEGKSRDKLYAQTTRLNQGSAAQRLRYAVLAGELASPGEALKQMQTLQREDPEAFAPSSTLASVVPVLEHLYRDYEKKDWAHRNVTAEDETLLRRELGWFGQLALTPADTPDRAARTALIEEAKQVASLTSLAGGLAGLCFLAGLVLLAVVGFLLLSRKRPSAVSPEPERGGVYAETFALWLGAFLGLGILSRFAQERFGPLPPITSAGVFLLSLFVLLWPRLRGIPWQTVRQDLGWHGGIGPLREGLLGFPTYLLSLPLLGIGVVLMLFLLRHFPNAGPSGGPSHPIVGEVAAGTWLVRLQYLLLASVVAPIVEETMFRGVLHKHLRSLTGSWGYTLSLGVSALVGPFLFAVIHPQGILAVPALMGLAAGFTLAREWRGTLLPAMVAHGINNGVALLVLIAIMD